MYTYLFMGKKDMWIYDHDITQLMLGRLGWEQVANKYDLPGLCPHWFYSSASLFLQTNDYVFHDTLRTYYRLNIEY